MPGEAARTRGEVKLVPSGKKSGSNLRVPRTDGSNVEQMLAETIVPVTNEAAGSDSDVSSHKRMKHNSHHADADDFKGAADELRWMLRIPPLVTSSR